jgi:hypothetical protein
MNLVELFNANVIQPEIIIDEDTSTASLIFLPRSGQLVENPINAEKETVTQLVMLDKLSKINKPAIFGILVRSYKNNYPAFIEKLSKQENIQFVHLTRADVLYGIISTIICDETTIWHNKSDLQQERYVEKRIFNPSVILYCLNAYLDELKEIRTHFNSVHTIYYEQFQFNVSNLHNLFSGIPKKIISIPFNKFVGNYKDIIKNLDEIEDLYEKFVNEHAEYFPQYFGKLPDVIIPACQGRQPRDLSKCGN